MRNRVFESLLTLTLLLGPLAFWLTYSGPYWYIDGYQLGDSAASRIFIAFIGTTIIWFLEVFVAVTAISKAFGSSFEIGAYFVNYRKFVERITRAAFFLSPIVMSAIAGYLIYLSNTLTSPTHVELADLIAGKGAPTRFITIDHANAAFEMDQMVRGRDQYQEVHYYPLLPADYHSGDPVFAFLEKPVNKSSSGIGGITTGVVSFTGMPGSVATAFTGRNTPPARGYVVVSYGTTPADLGTEGWILMWFALAFYLLVIFFVVHEWRSKRRKSAASSAASAQDSPA